jgi:hypothetical protein
MTLSSMRVCIAPGEGLVARQGSSVVVVSPSGAEHDPFIDQLLGLCAANTEDQRYLLRRVGALVTGTPPESVPAFGILVETGDSIVALLAGEVSLAITTSQGVEIHEGTDASTYVERRLRGDYESLWLAATGALLADPRSRLGSGVVPGAGMLLLSGATDLPVTAVPPAESDGVPSEQLHEEAPDLDADEATEPTLVGQDSPPTLTGDGASYESISLFEEPPETVAGEPPATQVPADGDSQGQAPLVDGIYCSRGHFNSPESIFCTQCGISMVQQTHNRVRGPRPPLGVIVTDQGAVFSLVRDYVVGREPESAPEVVAGAAMAMALEDPELAMSRIHTRILLDGWEVRVEDATSANGTFVAHGEGEWTRLEAGLPTTVTPGTRIAVGGRTLFFESHQRS